MNHLDNSTCTTLPLRSLAVIAALCLSACSNEIESDSMSSACVASTAEPLPFQSVMASASARSYSEQPQVLDFHELGEDELVVMSATGSASYVAVYDRNCALGSRELAFPEVKPHLVDEELNYKALEVWVDASDFELRLRASQDVCLKALGPNRLVRLSGGGLGSQGWTPDDPRFLDQSHHTFLESEAAWDIFYGEDGITEASEDVVVAVVDTGINTLHEDLAGQFWDDGEGNAGRRFTNGWESTYTMDDNGHGTHVAGLIAAQIGNKKGGAGVAPRNVKLMAMKALDFNGNGYLVDVVDAVNWAAQKGADVINLSLGVVGSASTVRTAIENAIAEGAFVAVAAGNSQADLNAVRVDPAFYGAEVGGLMSVGSLDVLTGLKSLFSNHSSTRVEIFAPGSHGYVENLGTAGLLSTVGVASYSNYVDFNGTSMASPLVAGAAALMIAYYKEAGRSWTPALIETQIKEVSPQNCGLWSYGQAGRHLNLKALAEKAKQFVE